MDGGSFDDIARRLGGAAGSRRRLLRDLAVGAGGGALALLGRPDGALGLSSAAAAGDGTCRAANPSQFVSKNSCQRLPCGPGGHCLCVQTIGHVPTCVTNFNPNNRHDCPKENECGEGHPCRAGFVCAKVMGCCGGGRRKCLRRCEG